MNDDAELLRQYADDGSEAAFAELVRRHLGLVYHAALRQTAGDTQCAQDVAQEVFTSLARKARALAQRPTLAGWLHTSTRYEVLQAQRTERRRQARELEAYVMSERQSHGTDGADWERLKPMVDEALHALSERDREAVLLRYFEGRPFAEVGAKLAVTEDAARVRVDRALDKLRVVLARHGVTSTAAALAMALANQAGAAVPAGLAATVTSGALAAGTAPALVYTLMNLTKLKTALALGVVAMGATAVVVQQHTNTQLRAEITQLNEKVRRVDALDAENARLTANLAQQKNLRQDDADLMELMSEESGIKAKVIENLQRRANASEATVARLTARLAEVSPYDMAELDRVPIPVTGMQTPPVYPVALLSTGVEGQATMEYVIDATGAVKDAKAVAATDSQFAEAAIKAVQQWKFSPGVKGGLTVSTRVHQQLQFVLPKNN